MSPGNARGVAPAAVPCLNKRCNAPAPFVTIHLKCPLSVTEYSKAGSPTACARKNGDHYQILVTDGDKTLHRIAVNVLSKLKPSELLYVSTNNLPAKFRSGLKKLKPGYTEVPSKPGGLAIDFVRGGLIKKSDMKIVPNIKPGPGNDLGDLIDEAVMKAIHEDKPMVYAFGEKWGPEKGKTDKYFDFEPGNGIHDIHMNQGNAAQFKKDDGIWQDGALILHFPAGSDGPNEKWIAIFLAFQSQSWDTDEKGHAKKNKKPK
ncbi:MAG: DUF2278 family protein [Acidobacteria bacterium]|nr:DUF2278 family protein [Acidobacteriota bacterium]